MVEEYRNFSTSWELLATSPQAYITRSAGTESAKMSNAVEDLKRYNIESAKMNDHLCTFLILWRYL